MKLRKKSYGFTLVESMIAMSIGLVVAGAAIWFLVEGLRISLKTAAASANDLAEWGILTGVTVDTKIANSMTIYPDFDHNTIKDQANRCITGQTGNVLILAQTIQSSTKPAAAKIQRITGYVFDPSYHTFKKFSYNVTLDEQKTPDSLETILNNNYDKLVFEQIAENVKGGLSGMSFLCRDSTSQSGELNIQVSSGHANVNTGNNKLISASFHIRG